MPPKREERRLAAVMFADVVGYTSLMAANEEAGVRARRRHRELARPLVEAYGGRWVEERGDESLSVFQSALDAVNCALAIQQATAAEPNLRLRVGIDLGDVVFEDEGIYGDGVNVAARVRETAEPGGIHVTRRVIDSVKNQAHIDSRIVGNHQLKNIAQPIQIFALVGHPGPPPSSRSDSGSVEREIRSLAVLPLENLSGDPQQDALVEGMTESLVSALANVRSLNVVSRRSTLQYAGSRKPLPEIARELDVEGVIAGSVVREADRVRVSVQLIDGSSDRHIWAETYERYVRGILPLQSEIARTVAQSIRVQLTPSEEALLAGPVTKWFARMRRLGIPED
jgi:adenylate cyclase